MARTVLEGFKQLRQNLEITGLQHTTVSIRQQNIRNAVKGDLDIRDSFLTGSYSRHTMIAPLKEADIDIFIILDDYYFYHYNGKNGGQAGLIDLVKRTLKRTYPKTPDISRNGQAVTITFTDFMVDVIPAFEREGGGYFIPNSINQSWIATDPKAHVHIMSAANEVHNGDLVPLIKMIKGWNRTINNHFRSFHLEVMALQILDNVRVSDFPSGMRYFFDKARTHVRHQNPDPAGYKGDVGDYLNTQSKIDDAAGRFQSAYSRAVRAESAASRFNMAEAIDLWRTIFDNYFPAYG